MKNGVYFTTNKEYLKKIYKLRYDIYKNELNRNMDSMNHEEQIDYSLRDEDCRHVCVVDNNELVGTVRVTWGAEVELQEEDNFEYSWSLFETMVSKNKMMIVDRLMLRKAYRKSVYPFHIFELLTKFVTDNNIMLLFCCCEPHLVNLYEMIAFRKYKNNIEYPGAGFMVPLVCISGDFAYAQKINSPLLGLYKQNDEDQKLADKIYELIEKQINRNSSKDKTKNRWMMAQEFADLTQSDIFNFFHNLTNAQIDLLRQKSQVIKITGGQQLIKVGNPARNLYVVLSGLLEARCGEKALNIMKKGEVFGEIAFLLNHRRTADVYAKSDEAEILMLSESTINDFSMSDPKLLATIFYNLSRILSIRLVNATTKNFDFKD